MSLLDDLLNTSPYSYQSMSRWGTSNYVSPGFRLDGRYGFGLDDRFLPNETSFGFKGLGGNNTTPPASKGLWNIEGLTPVNAMGLGLQALSGLAGLIGARKQLSLQRDALNFQKDAFNKNYENQRKLTNAQLEDRQRSRIASNPGAYMSVDEYMKKYGV